jgi:predicted ArsR family transcriptional regulator
VTSSRKLILDYLQHKPLTTTVELSRALKMTPANVRHHLRVLIEEGAVEAAEQGISHGRGRPTLLYALTQQSQSHNLDGLAHALLKTHLGDRPAEERSLALLQIARLLTTGEDRQLSDQRASLKASLKASLTYRLYQTVQRLNQLGYQARWEAHSQAPHLLFGHCPYATILPEHPELCQMDAYLLESLLGAPVTQTKKRAQDSRGARYCLFLAGKSNP